MVPALVATACSSNGSGAGTAGGAIDGSANGGDAGNPLPIVLEGEDGGGAGVDDGSSLPTSIVATIRDFRFYDGGDPTTNPDFENPPNNIDPTGDASPGYTGPWDDPNVVTTDLGSDGTPTYAGDPTKGTLTTFGNGQANSAATNFAAWYHDTPGTNISVQWPVPLVVQSDGSVEYDSALQGPPYGSNTPVGPIAGNGFFPIDDGTPYATSFGNQGWPNNYSFTCEIRTVFVYKGGEYFNFRGDDDVYVFINGKRVINLGGIHSPETASVQVDALGLTVGQQYPLDFFSAERHTSGSNILFQTTLALRAAPAPQ